MASSIEEALRDDACSFEFFQAVSLLHRLAKNQQPVGRFFNPEDECVRFAGNNQLAFPAGQIQSLEWPDAHPPRMTVNFMGITGPMGVLPYCYSELILERSRSKDHALAAFLDVFNHRAVSLFYRAWEKHQFLATYGREDNDVFSHHLLDLVGLGTGGLQHRQVLPDEGLMHYIGLLSLQSRSAAALQQILEDYFDVPVQVEQYAGAWYPLDVTTQCCMDDDESESQRIGSGAVVGDQVWDQQSRVRLILGPLSMQQYREFLPEGGAFEPLRALTRFFSNDEFDFEVQLVLKREDAPSLQLGVEEESAPQLGWATWLKSAPMQRDPGETVLNL